MYVSVCMYCVLSVCLSLNLPVCLYVRLHACICEFLNECLFFCLFIWRVLVCSGAFLRYFDHICIPVLPFLHR